MLATVYIELSIKYYRVGCLVSVLDTLFPDDYFFTSSFYKMWRFSFVYKDNFYITIIQKIYKCVLTAEIIGFEIRCVITVKFIRCIYCLALCSFPIVLEQCDKNRGLKIICYTLLVSKMHEVSSIVFFFFLNVDVVKAEQLPIFLLAISYLIFQVKT